jgi:hypothetical protein
MARLTFSVEIFGPNESFNLIFDTAVLFEYYDPIWTNIKGQVVVIPQNYTSLNTNNSNNESIRLLDMTAPVQNDTKTSINTGNTIQIQHHAGKGGENSVTQTPPPSQQQP